MDVLVIAGRATVPDFLIARNTRVVDLADAEVSPAVMVDLRARLPRRVTVVGPFAAAVAARLHRAGLPVQTIGGEFDLGTPAAETPPFRLERGAVLGDAEAELRLFKGLPSSLFHYRRGAQPLTFESPRPRPWDERIAAHRVFVTTVLTAL